MLDSLFSPPNDIWLLNGRRPVSPDEPFTSSTVCMAILRFVDTWVARGIALLSGPLSYARVFGPGCVPLADLSVSTLMGQSEVHVVGHTWIDDDGQSNIKRCDPLQAFVTVRVRMEPELKHGPKARAAQVEDRP